METNKWHKQEYTGSHFAVSFPSPLNHGDFLLFTGLQTGVIFHTYSKQVLIRQKEENANHTTVLLYNFPLKIYFFSNSMFETFLILFLYSQCEYRNRCVFVLCLKLCLPNIYAITQVTCFLNSFNVHAIKIAVS